MDANTLRALAIQRLQQKQASAAPRHMEKVAAYKLGLLKQAAYYQALAQQALQQANDMEKQALTAKQRNALIGAGVGGVGGAGLGALLGGEEHRGKGALGGGLVGALTGGGLGYGLTPEQAERVITRGDELDQIARDVNPVPTAGDVSAGLPQDATVADFDTAYSDARVQNWKDVKRMAERLRDTDRINQENALSGGIFGSSLLPGLRESGFGRDMVEGPTRLVPSGEPTPRINWSLEDL